MIRNRRDVLTALAAGGVLLAGCVDGNDDASGNDSQPAGGGGTSDDGGDEDPPASVQPDERFHEGCPSYNADRVICWDAVDPAELLGYLEPGNETIVPGEPLTFTLVNDSDGPLHSNFYNWRLHKQVDDEWFGIAPTEWPEPLMSLGAGERHEWELTVDNTGLDEGESVPRSSGTSELSVGGLGGGRYAFRARGWFEGSEERIAFAATFDLDADPIELTPTKAIEGVEWDGDTLVAQSTRRDPDQGTLGAFELERVDSGRYETERIITEQVFRQDLLRDGLALAHVHDADHVRIEEYSASVPIFARVRDGTFEYQGEYYEVSTREIEE